MPISITQTKKAPLALNGKRESTGGLKNSWATKVANTGIKHTVRDTEFISAGTSGTVGNVGVDVKTILGKPSGKIYHGVWRMMTDNNLGDYLQSFSENKETGAFEPTNSVLVFKENPTGYDSLVDVAGGMGKLQTTEGEMVANSSLSANGVNTSTSEFKPVKIGNNTWTRVTSSNGRPYYVSNTGKSAWALPSASNYGFSGVANVGKLSPNQVAAATNMTGVGKGANRVATGTVNTLRGKGPTSGTWVKKMSKSKGKPYWVRTNDPSQTTWYPPSGNATVVSNTSGGRMTRKARASRGSKRTRRH